ncbi:dephospho-CoA kinase [Litorivivens lipolytica]|uniref:Dephospho-CoA kinase n=1 Tax=Litorivivens lipolytica TaxID=1524264 RepID=A0A7W4W421_9GAMM|nr:dephospho-CoA kinase [Litorivivens lipolytica]MBB3047066.1 dephospho-CoA kinase [Litorivivens lipolytica]
MFVIGLTGGIGSGKSAASRRFEQHGIVAVDADVISRQVVEPGSEALTAIQARHGDSILLSDGGLDRAALRQKIFSSPEEKAWLEGLLHPLIADETLRQLEAATSPYVLFVSPLLVESGQKVLCHRLLVIDVPESLQLERTMARDNNPRDQVERIMASQASREQRLAVADDVICNDRDLDFLEGEVDRLHTEYLKLAAEHA